MLSLLYGRLIARILPVGMGADYEQTRKPLLRMIDPSTLCPGTGYAHYDPWERSAFSLLPPSTASTEKADELHRPHDCEQHPQQPQQQPQQEQHITLDMYLFDKRATTATTITTASKATTERTTTTTPHIRMNRIASDDVNKTLKRMEVSLAKKLKSIANRNSVKRSNLNNNNYNDNGTTRTSQSDDQSTSSTLLRWTHHKNGIVTPVPVPHSSSSSAGSHTSMEQILDHFEPWDLTATTTSSGKTTTSTSATWTNAQIWSQVEYPLLAVLIQIGSGDNQKSIPFLVEQNPPSIVGVRTFESFSGHVYTQVPLVLEVDVIHGTHAKIDWYVNGEMACCDSSTFVPRDDHIGKYVSVLITPIRQEEEEEEEEKKEGHVPHDGSGCQEAYRFSRRVEALPFNIVHALRPSWTAPRVQPPPQPSESDAERQQSSPSSSSSSSSPALSSLSSQHYLRVVSYNILADQNAFSGDNETPFYPYVPANILLRSRRMPLIVHEVLSYQADVICLQEVDEFVYDTLLRPVLGRMGYQGFFSVKQTGGTQEGCAMFWSMAKFERANDEDMRTHVLRDIFPKPDCILDDATLQTWNSLANIQQVLARRPDLMDIIDNKLGHVLQTAYLRLKRNNNNNNNNNDQRLPEQLLVANTHLFYHPHADHIRLMQSLVILYQLDQVSRSSSSTDARPPILFCGDLNTSPTNCAVRLILHRHVPKNFKRLQHHLNTFYWGDSDKTTTTTTTTEQSNHEQKQYVMDFPAMQVPQHFPTLISAYGDNPPKFTHYIACFHGCLDHIFVTPSSKEVPHGLQPIAMAPMPTVEDVTQHSAMPSEFLPSDHVSLVCDFEFTTFYQQDQQD